MAATPDPAHHDAYLRGVDALLDGRLDEALRELAAGADGGHPEAALALAKAHLRRGHGAEARARLEPLLAEPPADAGLHAYLVLLLAFASALDVRTEEALRLLEGVPRLDPRMEFAARTLQRRLEKGRLPDIRF